MILTNPGEPEEVLNSLSDLHPRISQIMEAAIASARGFFETNNKDYDVWLFSHLVRSEAREGLERIEQTDIDLIGDGFITKDLAFSGLEFNYRGYRIKILKGRDGLLPSVGRSRAKREFFFQQSLLGMTSEYLSPLKLVIVWNIDTNYNLIELRLACPRSPESYPENSSEYWSISIPPASSTVIVAQPFDDPVEDLPFALPPLQITGTDSNGNDEDNENN